MQEYADQECAAKDNEISRLNGIITEQQRLSNLVSGDLQNAKKEIQELREGGKALILELNEWGYTAPSRGGEAESDSKQFNRF